MKKSTMKTSKIAIAGTLTLASFLTVGVPTVNATVCRENSSGPGHCIDNTDRGGMMCVFSTGISGVKCYETTEY